MKTKIELKDCVGKVVLVKPYGKQEISEMRIEEISPSGEYYKADGQWQKNVLLFEIVDVLRVI